MLNLNFCSCWQLLCIRVSFRWNEWWRYQDMLLFKWNIKITFLLPLKLCLQEIVMFQKKTTKRRRRRRKNKFCICLSYGSCLVDISSATSHCHPFMALSPYLFMLSNIAAAFIFFSDNHFLSLFHFWLVLTLYDPCVI